MFNMFFYCLYSLLKKKKKFSFLTEVREERKGYKSQTIYAIHWLTDDCRCVFNSLDYFKVFLFNWFTSGSRKELKKNPAVCLIEGWCGLMWPKIGMNFIDYQTWLGLCVLLYKQLR